MSWDQLLAALASVAAEWAGRIGLALVVGVVAWVLGRAARGWVYRASARMSVDPNIRFLAGQLLFWFVLAVGLLVILALIGVDTSVTLATFGAAGLALGLALQDILKGFLAGLYLLFERPFLIGDEIQVGNHIGRVERVGFRATVIRTDDNVLVVLPNVLIFNEVMSNRTHRRLSSDEGSSSGSSS